MCFKWELALMLSSLEVLIILSWYIQFAFTAELFEFIIRLVHFTCTFF